MGSHSVIPGTVNSQFGLKMAVVKIQLSEFFLERTKEAFNTSVLPGASDLRGLLFYPQQRQAAFDPP